MWLLQVNEYGAYIFQFEIEFLFAQQFDDLWFNSSGSKGVFAPSSDDAQFVVPAPLIGVSEFCQVVLHSHKSLLHV